MVLSAYSKLVNRFNRRTESQIILYRSVAIVALFALLAYFVYLAPIGLDRLFCVILFIMFWYSKSDYFWFAFFLIIPSFPAGFFTETSIEAIRRLPLFTIFPKASFSVLDTFLIIALLKAIVKQKKNNYRDVFKIKNIVYIFPYVLIVSMFYGITFKLFFNASVRGLFFYTLIYSFPILIYDKKEVYKFMAMFLPFAIIELISQLYAIKTGTYFGRYLGPLGEGGEQVDTRIIAHGYLVLRLAYIFAFVLMESKEKILPKAYSMSIVLIILLSVTISATRSAIITLLLIFISYFIYVAKKRPNIYMQLFIVVIVLVTVLDYSGVIDLNSIIGASYKRLVGAVSISEYSIKAEDSFDYRISVRLPKLIESIKGSIFVGYGLSDTYYEKYDGHLGGVPVGLLQVGVLGFVIYIIFVYRIFKKSLLYARKLPNDNSNKGTIKVFVICFFGYLIINSTVNPIFVLNTSTFPQDILIHIILTSLFIYFAVQEEVEKKLVKNRKVAINED